MPRPVSLVRWRRRWGQVLGLSVAFWGILGCVGLPFGGFIPEVMLDTSVFDRSGFNRASLAGTWEITNSDGQNRRAVFDSEGNLVSFALPSGESFNGGDPGFVEDVLMTTFGAISIFFENDSSASGGALVIHEFEGLFDDDGGRIDGEARTVADDGSSNRLCTCNETWIRVSQ